MDPEKLRTAREKITRVFRYLEALNQHRNPPKRQIKEQPWHLWLHDLPVHPAVRQSASKPGSGKGKSADAQTEAAAGTSERNGFLAGGGLGRSFQPGLRRRVARGSSGEWGKADR